MKHYFMNGKIDFIEKVKRMAKRILKLKNNCLYHINIFEVIKIC